MVRGREAVLKRGGLEDMVMGPLQGCTGLEDSSRTMVGTLSEVYREDVLQGDDLGNLLQTVLPGMMGTDIGSSCFGPLLVFP